MKTNYDMHFYENKYKQEGYKIIAGTDEAGRGPIFGPVVAACCVLKEGFKLDGLTDSKQLSEKKRDSFIEYIKENTYYGISIIDYDVIDEINIYQASRKAMLEAIEKVDKQIKIDFILTDAMPLPTKQNHEAIIKGDAKSITIAAASVIAKVTRDQLLYEADKLNPEYGFKNHKGYPTKKHIENINKYGLIEGYRKTYGPVKRLLEEENL